MTIHHNASFIFSVIESIEDRISVHTSWINSVAQTIVQWNKFILNFFFYVFFMKVARQIFPIYEKAATPPSFPLKNFLFWKNMLVNIAKIELFTLLCTFTYASTPRVICTSCYRLCTILWKNNPLPRLSCRCKAFSKICWRLFIDDFFFKLK